MRRNTDAPNYTVMYKLLGLEPEKTPEPTDTEPKEKKAPRLTERDLFKVQNGAARKAKGHRSSRS